MNEGIRCMRKAPICCQMLRPGPKASRANILMNKIAAIHRTLGSQKKIFEDFSIIILIYLNFPEKLYSTEMQFVDLNIRVILSYDLFYLPSKYLEKMLVSGTCCN
jgi:hypothetical protein